MVRASCCFASAATLQRVLQDSKSVVLTPIAKAFGHHDVLRRSSTSLASRPLVTKPAASVIKT